MRLRERSQPATFGTRDWLQFLAMVKIDGWHPCFWFCFFVLFSLLRVFVFVLFLHFSVFCFSFNCGLNTLCLLISISQRDILDMYVARMLLPVVQPTCASSCYCYIQMLRTVSGVTRYTEGKRSKIFAMQRGEYGEGAGGSRLNDIAYHGDCCLYGSTFNTQSGQQQQQQH